MKYLLTAALAASIIPAHATIVDITINNFQFGSANAPVTVNVGDTVRWTNMDIESHTVTSGASAVPDGKFDSGTLDPPNTYSVTFRRPGTFPYFCQFHSTMVSSIVVQQKAKTVTVTVQNTVFGTNNAPTNINQGDSVEWVWVNGTHTVTSGTIENGVKVPDGLFNASMTLSATKFTHQFNDAGTFPYYCSPHGICCGMKSSVVVTAGPIYGDANGDGKVDASDVAADLQLWAGLSAASPAAAAQGDVYPSGFGDGAIDLQDVSRLIRFVGGADTTPL